MDRYLTGLRPEDKAFYAHQVADIILLKIRVRFLPDTVPRHIALYRPFQVLHIAKRRLPHHALAHQTSRDGHMGIFQRLKLRSDLLTVVRHIIFCDLKRISPRLLQSG